MPQLRLSAADIGGMIRVLGIPAVLVVAVVGIYLSMQDAKTNGSTSASGQQAITQAQSEAAAANLGQAVAAMQASYAHNGTYAGATLPVGSGVTLVRADAYSYCLQAGDEHEAGPNGQPQPGPC
jgi:methylthioribose-1-phosphate isomerase